MERGVRQDYCSSSGRIAPEKFVLLPCPESVYISGISSFILTDKALVWFFFLSLPPSSLGYSVTYLWGVSRKQFPDDQHVGRSSLEALPCAVSLVVSVFNLSTIYP